MARYQSNRASCGPAALCNALAALGVERTEDELIRLTGQTPDGVGVKGMVKALRAISSEEHQLAARGVAFRDETSAKMALWYEVSEAGRPFILCVDGLEHWVACTGHVGPRFVVIDSAHVGLVLYYDWAALRGRWADEEGRYYGIGL